MTLPQSPKLNITALGRSFDDMSESYKIFWFKGIMDIVMAGRDRATFYEIITRMVSAAWFMVSEYHLNLGPSDTLEKLVLRAQSISELRSASKPEVILEFLENTNDPDIKGYLRVLTLNVPYRLQAPFLQDVKGSEAWKKANVVAKINRNEELIYHFGPDKKLDTQILITPRWFEYLFENQTIITGWIEYNMILYLPHRNPSVPGIANKIAPPAERKLEAAKRYWKAIADVVPLRNIYDIEGGILVPKEISIDHFVPWSYVTHDELWNLVPTTKSLNSSKSNSLADWDMFFPRLCGIEYMAYESIWNNDRIRDLFEKCSREHLNNDEIRFRLYGEDIAKDEYAARLKEILLPVYTSVRNIGFGEWHFNG